jgi:hypothetical protein
VQQGKFDALVSADGKFRQLWEKQMKEPPSQPGNILSFTYKGDHGS